LVDGTPLAYETPVESDCAPLAGLVAVLIDGGVDPHCLRDVTRGGLATVLNEIATDAGAGCAIEVEEAAVPVSGPVAGACEILGLDPLYVACEGRMVAFVPEATSARVLGILRSHPLGAGATRIGAVGREPAGMVTLRTRFGAPRLLDLLSEEQLPRIC
jgi:hydrogenase expression/formation protein HypE